MSTVPSSYSGDRLSSWVEEPRSGPRVFGLPLDQNLLLVLNPFTSSSHLLETLDSPSYPKKRPKPPSTGVAPPVTETITRPRRRVPGVLSEVVAGRVVVHPQNPPNTDFPTQVGCLLRVPGRYRGGRNQKRGKTDDGGRVSGTSRRPSSSRPQHRTDSRGSKDP